MLWATTEGTPSRNTFYKFMGWLTSDGKYVDTGLKRYKLTSKEGTAFITIKDNKYFIDSEELIIEADNNRILIGNKVYEGA